MTPIDTDSIVNKKTQQSRKKKTYMNLTLASRDSPDHKSAGRNLWPRFSRPICAGTGNKILVTTARGHCLERSAFDLF